jgi:hypothetical protein
MEKLNRSIVSKKNIKEIDVDDIVRRTPAQLFGMVWEITKDVWAFSGTKYVDQRLQRNVANLIRGRR